MGFAEELAKNTKSKQQIETERKAYEAKLHKAWQIVFSEVVEYEALNILSACSKVASEGKRSYVTHISAPRFPGYASGWTRPVYKIGEFHFSFTQDSQAYQDAEKFFEDHKPFCYNEYKTALVARLRKEGVKVKLDNGTMLSLINDQNTYSQICIKIKW